MQLQPLHRIPLVVMLLLFGAGALTHTFAQQPTLKQQGIFEVDGAEFDEGAAEIAAFDSATDRVFFVNADANEIVALDISDPANPTEVYTISGDARVTNGSANSVDAHDGLIAVAIEAESVGDDGAIVFYDAQSGDFENQVNVGKLPDKVTFADDGNVAISADEGEPSDDYGTDPKGTVSFVDLSGGVSSAAVSTVDFTAYNESGPRTLDSGIRIFGGSAALPNIISVNDADPAEITFDSDVSGEIEVGEWITIAGNEDPIPYRVTAFSNAGQTVTLYDELDGDTEYSSASDLTAYRNDGSSTVAQDLEPEFVTAEGTTAYVTLQENNAVAEINFSDPASPRINQLQALGFKDHSQPGNGLDPTSEDDQISVDTYPLNGIYQPDAIASMTVNGNTYLLTANEGDAREYDGFVEEVEIGDLRLADNLNADLQDDDQLGELITTTALGVDGYRNDAGEVTALYSYGARSFSVWNPDNFDGGGDPLVYDSGDFFEQQTALSIPNNFNDDNDETGFEERSEDKGPEPEAVETARVDGTPYVFVALERVGGVMVFEFSDPANPEFVEYRNDRDFTISSESELEEEETLLGPESLTFIPASENANSDTDLLAISHEVSGVVAFYTFEPETASVDRSFGGASDPANYRLVALPGLDGRSIADVVSGDAGTEWQAYRDDGTESNFLKPFEESESFSFQPGNGFWLTAKSNWTFSELVETVDLRKDAPATIPLRGGWNIISNPTDKNIRWSQISRENDGVNQPLWAFDGTFTRAETFASAKDGEAYYFFNSRGLTSLTIPYPNKAAPKEENTESLLAITAAPTGRKAGDVQSTVQIGLRKDAKEGIGSEDLVAPPSQFESVSLRLKASTAENTTRGRYLMAEQRPLAEADGQTFRLRLKNESDAPVQLRPEGLRAVSGNEVALLNPSAGTSHDLRETSSVQVNPDAETTTLTVAVGTEKFVERQARRIAPDEMELDAYPNPIRQDGTFEYTLVDGGEVTLRLYDTLGRVVKTLDNGEKKTGRHRVRFQSDQLSSGIYFARLTVEGQIRTEKITVVR